MGNKLTMKLHIHIEGMDTLLDAVRDLSRKADIIINQGKQEISMNEDVKAALDDLRAKVAAETTVDASAVTLLNGLSAQLAALASQAAANGATDPAVLQAISDIANGVAADSASLSAAVVANTPAAAAQA